MGFDFDKQPLSSCIRRVANTKFVFFVLCLVLGKNCSQVSYRLGEGPGRVEAMVHITESLIFLKFHLFE